MDSLSVAWVIAGILMVAVLLYGWGKVGFGRAFIAMLLVGKLIAAIYYIVGLDRPVMTLVFRNGARVTLTAAELVFLSFLFTLIGTIMVVVYGRILPKEIREVMHVDRGA